LDFHGEELRLIDRELGRVALGRDDVRRLMTIPGVDATVALSIVAAVGDFTSARTRWQGDQSGRGTPRDGTVQAMHGV
jgi:transposase